MLHKILFLLLICGMVMISGCGEEEATLSELIVGSWRDTELESAVILIPFDGGTLIPEMSCTLTFYGFDRFDNVLEMSVALNGQHCTVKTITQGTYQAFDTSLTLRATSSEVQVMPPDFEAVAESLSPMAQGMESMLTDTVSASVAGQTLTLDGSPWQRL